MVQLHFCGWAARRSPASPVPTYQSCCADGGYLIQGLAFHIATVGLQLPTGLRISQQGLQQG
ncbi:MAG: hypothetical protein AAF892_13075, partial [Cyanobacteria bacterium P01_D01_bin.71]